MADPIPEGAIPEEEFNQNQPTQSNQAIPADAIPEEDFQAQQNAQHGNPLEMAKTALEQGLSGATLGASKIAETKLLGVKPEDIAGREASNPITAGLSNIAGTAGLILGTGGLGALGEGAGVAARVGLGALEGAGIGGITTATDDWSQNKALDAQKIAANAGLGALLGGVGSSIAEGIKYKLGTPLAKSADSAIDEIAAAPEGEIKPVISQLDSGPYQAGDLATAVENSPALPPQDAPKVIEGIKDVKPNADKIIDAAKQINSPVLEGMTSSNSWVQKAEDALVNGPPTVPGIARQRAYQQVFDAVKNATNTAIGEGSSLSKADLGNQLKNSITQQISDQVQPINNLYNAIKQYHSVIPLSEDAAPAISNQLEKLQEFRIAPSSPEGQLVKRVINEIPNLKTVDDVKAYNSILNRSISPTASSGERRMAGIISDQLGRLEENSISKFAKSNAFPPEAQPQIQSLIDQRLAADAAYKPFKQNLNTLAEQLGKGKVYGAQDAIDFIQNRLTPEEVTQRLFSKNNSEFLKFFSKNFPDQMSVMRQYQKGVLREAASKGGEFTPTTVFREVNKLQPEIQQAIFSPQELSQLKAAETVRQSIPKSFNPSGTSHITAFRAFFEHPTGALIANTRDLAISQYVKRGGGPVLNAISQALQKHASKTSASIDQGIKTLFSASASQTRKAP